VISVKRSISLDVSRIAFPSRSIASVPLRKEIGLGLLSSFGATLRQMQFFEARSGACLTGMPLEKTMENETISPVQPESLAESATLQEIRQTKQAIEEGVRHLERVDQTCLRAMLLSLDLLIALHQRHQNASVKEGD
jgi:hypothetical protein